MSISTEDFTIGQEATTRIKKYEHQKPKRLIEYLFPAVWLIGFIVRYEAKSSSWNLFQIIFWSLALIGLTIVEYRRRKTYLHDLATLEGLRELHGSDLFFAVKNTPIEAGKKGGDVIKIERDKWKGLYPLFAFSVFLAVMFTLTHFIHRILPSFFPHQ
jgi:hypothetical protein